MDLRDVISLSDLALRFARAKGMDETGYQWEREAPGRKRGDEDDELVGNSLAVLKAIRQFNASNREPIALYKVAGYDGTSKPTLVIAKTDIIRLKGYILRAALRKPGRRKQPVEFRVLEEIEI
jgi:hypothetical protein